MSPVTGVQIYQIDIQHEYPSLRAQIIVIQESAFIFNGIFESQKNVFSGQFFAKKNGQFRELCT
jgi:hypothetical protein